MAASDYINQVQSMYISYYGRFADQAGLNYWTYMLDANGGNLDGIIQAFGTSAEATALYPATLSTAQKVTNLYNSLFGRDPDAAGLTFYTNLIGSGQATLVDIAKRVFDGATANDAMRLANKVNLSNTLTQSIGATTNYSGDAAAATARALMSNVTDNASSVTVVQGVMSAAVISAKNSGTPITTMTAATAAATPASGTTVTVASETLVGGTTTASFSSNAATVNINADTTGGTAALTTLNSPFATIASFNSNTSDLTVGTVNAGNLLTMNVTGTTAVNIGGTALSVGGPTFTVNDSATAAVAVGATTNNAMTTLNVNNSGAGANTLTMAGVTSSNLAVVNLSNSGGANTALTFNSGLAGAVTVNVSGTTTGASTITPTIGSATSLTVNDSSSGALAIAALTANTITSLSLNNTGSSAITLNGGGISGSALTSITATGSVTGSITSTAGTATTVDISGATNATGLTIATGAAADTFTVGKGKFVLDGNGGSDTVSFASVQKSGDTTLAATDTGVSLTLNTTTPATVTVGGTNLTAASTVVNIENVTGSNGIDTIVGDSAANTILGGTGADIITGGTGADIINGQAGADTYNIAAGDSTSASIDELTYVTAEDIINFSTAAITLAANADAAGEATISAAGLVTAYNGAATAYDTFAEKLAQIDLAIGGTEGQAAVFVDAGQAYLYIAVGTDTSNNGTDVVVKLTGITTLATGITLNTGDISAIA